MEVILTSYRILFNLQFELAGYVEDLRPFIKVIPDEQTRRLYARYGMLSRSQKSSFTMLIEVEPQGSDENKPLFMLEDDMLFRYQVKFPNSFIDRTHLASYDLTDKVIHLTNEANHNAGSEHLLSLPIAAYDSGQEYRKGYIVGSSGNFFKALKENNSGDVHGVGEGDYWKSIFAGDTFVSQEDLKSRGAVGPDLDLDTVMVVEILHKAALPSGYELLDGSSICREVTYTIKLER